MNFEPKSQPKALRSLIRAGILWLVALVGYSAKAQLSVSEPEVRIVSIQASLLPTDSNNWSRYLMDKMGGKQSPFSLRFIGKTDGLLGPEYRYSLYLQDIPLLNGRVQISQYPGTNMLSNISFPDYDFQNAGEIESIPASKANSGNSYFYDWVDGMWKAIRAENYQSLRPEFESYTLYYDLENNRVGKQDWLDRFTPIPDSLVKAAVFRPDPSSRLQIPYSSSLKDRSDSNSVTLTHALDTTFIRVLYSQDTFQLRNTRFTMGEFSDPVKPLARLANPDFRFTRENPFFEEVNAFYHLNRIRQFVDSLGFAAYADYGLRVDAHGMNGADQSAYSPILDVLAFGEGGVDDAEDATVIVHEYCHALANDANPFSNIGLERKALEEGICDYVAGSYCKKQSAWNWEDIYKWDGHNEFWAGRTVMSTKHYPESLVNQIHQDGEIWSSAMMNIELQIGREATHKLLFSIFPQLTSNLKFSQAAYLFLKADTALNGAAYSSVIKQIFDSKGIGPGPIIVRNTFQKTSSNAGFDAYVDERNILRVSNLRSDAAEVVVLDLTGRQLLRVTKAAGQISLEISVESYPNSLLLIRLISHNRAETKRIIKSF